jgi:hypothetical protein
MTMGRAVCDRNVAAFDIAGVFWTLPDTTQLQVTELRTGEQSDQSHRALLRARRERPNRWAAEQSDELAPSHAPFRSSLTLVVARP